MTCYSAVFVTVNKGFLRCDSCSKLMFENKACVSVCTMEEADGPVSTIKPKANERSLLTSIGGGGCMIITVMLKR